MKLKAYLDLLRAHFIPAWILIFTAGYMTAVHLFGGFDLITLIKVILIAVFGFEAGMVLNDYVDRDLDTKDVDNSLTRYFRPFKTRPLASRELKPEIALFTFIVFAAIAAGIILTLSSPHRWYVLVIMVYSYLVEYFYQIKKRKQSFPWAQLVGRTDFSLFPVAGYLVLAKPDLNVLLYVLYFYPLAQAHLAINDLVDLENDKVRKLQSVPILWGVKGTVWWIILFTLAHIFTASTFVLQVNPAALPGFIISFIILLFAAASIYRKPIPLVSLKVLPLVHLCMAIQAIALIFLK